ncbi:MAG: T9SS type A sorting domain-containing protein [Hymenobacter sp.]|nr:MAG: T9SS type A sorting domain-containing protein [Hymenobacter sp.]
MKKPYTRTTEFAKRLRQLGLTALLAGGATVAAHAQTLNYATSSATNVTGTFTDLGTTGTVITTTSTDDANSAAQNIGFTFNYNGTAFTQFVLNTNGLIRLGSAAPSAANMFAQYEGGALVGIDPVSSTAAADVNLLIPFNFDLQSGTSPAEYRVSTTGTAQTTNTIEFVYGTATASTNTAIARYPTVGIKGSGSASGQDVLANKTASTGAWSTTTFITGVYGTSTHNFRSNVGPDAGRTYRFATVLANDAAVSAIYTYGKLATNSTLPHAVQAVITNAGSAAQTNLVATLNVTGANTFADTKTIATLAAGASTTVTFAAYPTTFVAGTNTVTVTVPADAVATNNTATYGQIVTADRVSYTNPSVTTVGGTVGVGSSGGALAAKYILPAPTVVSDVTLSFGTSTFATTNYQVVLYDAAGTGGVPGTVLYTSPTQTRTAAASTPVITLPGIAVPATFYIGVKELDNNPGLNYQTEDPLRPTTYYYSLDAATNWVSINTTTLRSRLAIEFGTTTVNCSPPTALTVGTVTATGATVTFTPPANGTGSYQVIYGPTGFSLPSGGTTVTATTSPVTLTGLTPATTYQVYVRSNCSTSGTSVFTSAVSFTTSCAPNPTVSAFPYAENFDTILAGQALPCGITVLNANNDAVTWRVSTENPNSGTNDIRYQGITANVAADDWFFTPALALPGTANTRFQVAFRYRAAGTGSTGTSNFTEALEVKSGATATVAGQTNLLYTNNSINNLTYNLANGVSAPIVAFLPAGASTQVVGFHVKSVALQGNLYIDDVSVTAVTVTATSEALLRATNVFPNPSATGVFNLEVNGANAKQGLEVEVVNNLGQRVYAGTARDNFTTQLDLSRLAAGLYHLKVKNGDEYLVRQISIVK